VKGFQSVVNALSARISQVAGGGFAASVRNSAGTSVQGAQSVVNVLSAKISDVEAHASAASAAATSVDARVNTVSNLVSVISQQVSLLSQLHSTLSVNVQAVSNAVSNEISNRISHVNVVSQAVSVLSQQVSLLSQAHSVLSTLVAAVSARTTAGASVKGLQSAVNALSSRLSGVAGGFVASARTTAGTSVQGSQSVINALSARISQAGGGGGGSVTSTELSAGLANITNLTQYRFRGASITVSAATLTDIPSMSVSLAAGGVYEIRGDIVFEVLTSGGMAFGFSAPALGEYGCNMTFSAVSAGGAQTGGAKSAGFVAMSAVAAGQTAVASISAATLNSRRRCEIDGFIHCSTAGTFQLMARASVVASGLLIKGAVLTAHRIV
jgi:hypothetical protein